jgi:hypothetical protein
MKLKDLGAVLRAVAAASSANCASVVPGKLSLCINPCAVSDLFYAFDAYTTLAYDP